MDPILHAILHSILVQYWVKYLVHYWVQYCQTPVLGLGLGVDFTFAGDNHKNHKNENNNPHLNFVKGTVLGDKEQEVNVNKF